jgi:hypothetical protein
MPIHFRPIARLLVHTINPAPKVDLSAALDYLQKMDQEGRVQGTLITVNHFTAPDFQAWWFAILISAVIPAEIHWVVTSGWTNSGWLTGFTHWLFPRGARLFGFTSMPAMPPNPAEAEQRAVAVRQVLRFAKISSNPIIGLAPEGGDQPGGVLGELPSGVGRFVHLLGTSCSNIIPVGVWKEAGCISIIFGKPYKLEIPTGRSAQELDRLVGNIVMSQIAKLLPERLRGQYLLT